MIMQNKKNSFYGTIDLTECECKHISGGSELTENITRWFGYVYQSIRQMNLDMTESSWYNNPRAQR